eukprot:6997292-Prymnesium_polylepis.1
MLKAWLVRIVLSEVDHRNHMTAWQVALHRKPVVIQPLSIVVMCNELWPVLLELSDKRRDGHAH